MRWKGNRRSRNVEDRRGQQQSFRSGGGTSPIMRLLPALIKTKFGRYAIVLGIIVIVGGNMMGVDLLPMLLGSGGSNTAPQSRAISAEDQELADFVTVVLADTEDTWHAIFKGLNRTYEEPPLVLFRGQVNSACGSASAAMGPFYCPGDNKVYIDLSFYNDLKSRHQAPGDFAQAYVIAHEVGHHVQNLLGTNAKVREMQKGMTEVQANNMSVRMELQADCYAGLWGYYAQTERNLLESGDLEEALVAATAIGDDRLQKQATGRVVPDSFTHGSSQQRVRWFKRGFENGKIDLCDTFARDANL